MYLLNNNKLEVKLLDPIADRDKFGVRYCTGGYIYQVSDPRFGNLLTGPTYPDSFNWFDGQGIPDAFNWAPLRAPDKDDSEVLILGIGLCDVLNKQVTQFCDWQIETAAQHIRFTTQQRFANYALQLVRTVSLHERTVRSHTQITNQGSDFIPINWFPHPFYAQPKQSDELCLLNIPIAIESQNQGYACGANGFIQRKTWPEQKGFYLPLEHQAQQPLTVLQRHDQLGLVGATCSYVPDYFPIWGNQHTFSWEPFFQHIVAPAKSISWWIDYHF